MSKLGMSKRMSYSKIYRWTSISIGRSDVRARPRLPRGRVFTIRADGKKRVHVDRLMRPNRCAPTSAQT
jgi:hypothetical protein